MRSVTSQDSSISVGNNSEKVTNEELCEAPVFQSAQSQGRSWQPFSNLVRKKKKQTTKSRRTKIGEFSKVLQEHNWKPHNQKPRNALWCTFLTLALFSFQGSGIPHFFKDCVGQSCLHLSQLIGMLLCRLNEHFDSKPILNSHDAITQKRLSRKLFRLSNLIELSAERRRCSNKCCLSNSVVVHRKSLFGQRTCHNTYCSLYLCGTGQTIPISSFTLDL